MKKSDLRYGDIVEARNGVKYVVYHNGSEKALVSLISGWCVGLDEYNENLTSAKDYTNFDIMKVYNDYTCEVLLWERKEKPQLTEDEKAILKVLLNEKYKWIARDDDEMLAVFEGKPQKVKRACSQWACSQWACNEGNSIMEYMEIFNNLFQFIQWEDEEPYSIEELLKGEEK